MYPSSVWKRFHSHAACARTGDGGRGGTAWGCGRDCCAAFRALGVRLDGCARCCGCDCDCDCDCARCLRCCCLRCVDLAVDAAVCGVEVFACPGRRLRAVMRSVVLLTRGAYV